MTKLLWKILAGAALTVTGASMTVAQELPTAKLVLDFSIQGQQSPFVLAADGGSFERAGVKVTVAMARLTASARSPPAPTTWHSRISAP